jgi:hypothetical protein
MALPRPSGPTQRSSGWASQAGWAGGKVSGREHDSPAGNVRLAPADRAELEALAALFAAARLCPAHTEHSLTTTIIPPVREDGTIAGLPWIDYEGPIASFWRIIHRLGLTCPGFDWQTWLDEPRASGAIPLDPQLVARHSTEDLCRYLTALERAERFSEGTWRAALDSGIFEAVLSRIVRTSDFSS